MALRFVMELPVTRRHVLDSEALWTVAAVDQVGDLTRFSVAEVPELAQFSAPEELLAPDERGWALGHALSLAVEYGQRLWLSEVPTQRLGLLRSVLGEYLVHIVSPETSDGAEAPWTDGADQGEGSVAVVANLCRLLDEWATGTLEQIRYPRAVLEGMDPLRASRHTLAALQEARVDLVSCAGIVRLLHNPRFLAYATVFIYSSLRALPAVYAPSFRGNPQVLWAIGIITAMPCIWGIIAMVAGKRHRIRFAGSLVTPITFVVPYVYFFLAGDDGRGNQYPDWVIMVVIDLVLATSLLEGGRWLRDVAVVRGLCTPGDGQPGLRRCRSRFLPAD